MSIVLWGNRLSNGQVVTDALDKPALHKHTDKLDELCGQIGLPAFSDLCDSTDARFNLEDLDLPDGMTSTDEVMAAEGVWVEAPQALFLLRQLLDHVRRHKTRFGLLRNDHDAVVAELVQSIEFFDAASAGGERVNFSVVM